MSDYRRHKMIAARLLNIALCLSAVSSPVFGQTLTFVTVAGNGTAGYSGDGGPATSAALNAPTGVAVDAAGNLYIADYHNSRIRKISNGVIATVAGNGTPGYSGDNGSAVSAELNRPEGIAVDAAGNIYIADSYNSVIRKVSNGLITTVAGSSQGYSGDNGPATAAQLNYVQDVAVDAAGNVYIADYGNNCIREVSNGIITSFAGTCMVVGSTGWTAYGGDGGLATNAHMWGPDGVAVDANGNVYISDLGNARIRKVSNGIITTVAGNGAKGSTGDGGPAINAELSYPVGVAVDAAGNLYISDVGGTTGSEKNIRKVANGIVTTVANQEADGIAVNAAGNLYVTDDGDNLIRLASNQICFFSLGSSALTVPAGANAGNTFSLSATPGCSWNASTTASFITVTGGRVGIGNGAVAYSVSANTSSSPRTGVIFVTGTSGFTVTQPAAATAQSSMVASATPTGNCASPAAQKYYAPGATIYPWISFSFSSPSDVVTAQVNTGLFVTLTRPTGGNCNYGPISGLSPGSYTVSFNLNGAPVAQQPVVIVSNQLTLSTVGTRAALPGNNQVNIQAAIPTALPDASTVTLTPSFTPTGVANAAAGTGAYDCRFLQGSVSLTVSANTTQSSQAPVSAGTVAGTCVFNALSVDIGSAGFADLIYPVSSSVALSNAATAPYIAGVSETASGSPFTLVVTGYSMTRDLSTITFTFTTTQSGYTISSGPLTANVQSPAVTWYTSAGSAATGGQFQYTQQFNITGGSSANLSQVTVTATSPTSGTSQPVTIQLQ